MLLHREIETSQLVLDVGGAVVAREAPTPLFCVRKRKYYGVYGLFLFLGPLCEVEFDVYIIVTA